MWHEFGGYDYDTEYLPFQINREYPQMQRELFSISTELSPRKKAVSQIHLADMRKKWFRKSSSYFFGDAFDS